MVNIYEIAKKAGVSHMTVSRAFNNPEMVNKKTLDKIMAIANDLGYRPSQIARSMRTKKTNYIGLILPDIINPFFPEIVRGVDDYARKNKYNVILANTDNDYEVQASLVEMFLSRGIDGIILGGIAGGKKDTELLNNIIKKGIPTVLIDRYIPDVNSSYVITDNFSAAYDATNYLIRLGHEKIGVVSSPQKIKIFQDRLRGYKAALDDNNIVFRDEYICEGDESIVGGYKTVKNLFTKSGDFTAIFAMCDFMAFGVYKYCREKDIIIPDDLSVISIDNIYTSAFLTPPLTTMSQKKYEMGYSAAKILIESIKKNKMPDTQLVLKARLIERKSCKKIK
ncbi:MAG: LacI family DNA-binding transcriptional regulator [Candidatus Humimicrobiaceae bacterium]|jgi:LacI family transcriptional regulator|nr:LacI family DNA-binding transcriptional regulator [Actinomycetota bacterium]MDD5600496.1 LacI family DNA-binding transcriptional regulator [Actinomycetota bacterium]MDY0028028.1 LacI family DNA-binding transcriptional regulator [Candidatus Humimicrobiaceae bacterium]